MKKILTFIRDVFTEIKYRLFRPEVYKRVSAKWTSVDSGLDVRSYKTYEEYIEHQKYKLAAFTPDTFTAYNIRLAEVICERFTDEGFANPGDSVLCLAARLGGEVKGFINMGCFAVGIDLEPGPDNHYVLPGDFHNLQFAAQSVDVVYTNSLDHALDLGKVFAEVKRVLKPGGFFVVDAAFGSGEHRSETLQRLNRRVRDRVGMGIYESSMWARIDNLVEHIEQAGFVVANRQKIDEAYSGEILLGELLVFKIA